MDVPTKLSSGIDGCNGGLRAVGEHVAYSDVHGVPIVSCVDHMCGGVAGSAEMHLGCDINRS